MASIDLRSTGQRGVPSFLEFSRPVWIKHYVNGSEIYRAKGNTAVAVGDTIEFMTIPTGFIIEDVRLERVLHNDPSITTVTSGGPLTISVGDTTTDNLWVDAQNTVPPSAGQFSAIVTQVANASAQVYNTANNLRITVDAFSIPGRVNNWAFNIYVKAANLRDNISRARPAFD